jgi:hypothetical protein
VLGVDRVQAVDRQGDGDALAGVIGQRMAYSRPFNAST